MKAKKVYEAIEDVFKPKPGEEVMKSLGEHGPLYAEITSNPLYKELQDLGFELISGKRQLDNGTVKFNTTRPVKLKQSNVKEISFRLRGGGYFRVNGNPMYKWAKAPTPEEALRYTVDWVKDPKPTELHGEVTEFKIKDHEAYKNLTIVKKECENTLKKLIGKRMSGRMEFYGRETWNNPKNVQNENRLWVQDIEIDENDKIFVKNGDYYFGLLPNATYKITEPNEST